MPFEVDVPETKADIGISYDDARKKANNFILDNNLDLNLAQETLISYITVSDPNLIEREDIENSDIKAYKFYYTREINGVPVTYDNNIRLGELSADYSAAVYYEMASVIVDENGIREFEYRAPYNVLETIEENAKIITLNDATDLFMQYLEQKYIKQGNMEEDIESIDVHTIKLGLTRIKNSDGGYILVPTYDFFGNIRGKNSDDISERAISPCYSVCTVNAIDGSIIDKSMGY